MPASAISDIIAVITDQPIVASRLAGKLNAIPPPFLLRFYRYESVVGQLKPEPCSGNAWFGKVGFGMMEDTRPHNSSVHTVRATLRIPSVARSSCALPPDAGGRFLRSSGAPALLTSPMSAGSAGFSAAGCGGLLLPRPAIVTGHRLDPDNAIIG